MFFLQKTIYKAQECIENMVYICSKKLIENTHLYRKQRKTYFRCFKHLLFHKFSFLRLILPFLLTTPFLPKIFDLSPSCDFWEGKSHLL